MVLCHCEVVEDFFVQHDDAKELVLERPRMDEQRTRLASLQAPKKEVSMKGLAIWVWIVLICVFLIGPEDILNMS